MQFITDRWNVFLRLFTLRTMDSYVTISTTPKVQYGYANGSANTIRSTSMTYPNGRVLTYDYGTAAGMNDVISRIGSLIDNDGTTHLSDYSYVGLGAFVVADYTQPDVQYTLVDLSGSNDPDTGDIYSGWDRFSRVKDCRWYDYGASTDIARLKYGYDRASNRLWRNDTVAQSLGVAHDELYTYDGVHRLKDMQRGTLNGPKTAVTSRNFEQCWTLDSTNNWPGFRESTNGSNWTTVQSRTANKVNEITNITNTTGSAWAATAHDAAGNMTSMPRPATLVNGYTAIYDAWNRLMAIKAGASFVQQNQYDGRTFRTVILTYSGGILSETRHSYFTNGWQCIEERTGTSTSAERQFVWGDRYIDDLVVRDRDSTGGGTLNQRNYVAQDANWNVTSAVSTTGTVQERYAYSAYGTPTFLTGTFGFRANSSLSWETLFSGYRLDNNTRLYTVRFRFYHPALGTWIQRDPLLYPDGPNAYGAWFVPAGTDPFGEMSNKWSQWPNWVDRDIPLEQLEKLIRDETNPAKRRELQKANKILEEWAKRLKDQVKNKGNRGGGRGRRGACSGGVVGGLFLFGCEAACAFEYQDHLNSAVSKYEDCIDGAFNMRGPLRSSQISACNTEVNLSFVEAAIVYTACGLSCLVPFSFSG